MPCTEYQGVITVYTIICVLQTVFFFLYEMLHVLTHYCLVFNLQNAYGMSSVKIKLCMLVATMEFVLPNLLSV